MREALANALAGAIDETSVDRILEAAFFRKRPLQAGAQPVNVVSLNDRRHRFLGAGPEVRAQRGRRREARVEEDGGLRR